MSTFTSTSKTTTRIVISNLCRGSARCLEAKDISDTAQWRQTKARHGGEYLEKKRRASYEPHEVIQKHADC